MKKLLIIIFIVFLSCLPCPCIAPKSNFSQKNAKDLITYDNFFDSAHIDTATFIDRIGVNFNDTVLMIGAGLDTSYPLAAAIRGVRVYVAQPEKYEDPFLTMNQNRSLIHMLKRIKTFFLNNKNIDPIEDRIDVTTYEGYVQNVRLPANYFSHIFLLSVLDQPSVAFQFNDICMAVFRALKPDGNIIISSKSEDPRTTAKSVQFLAKQLGYNLEMDMNSYFISSKLFNGFDPVIVLRMTIKHQDLSKSVCSST